MAAASSGLLVQTWLDALDATQLALELTLTTHKVAMFTNSITNDLTSNTAYQYGVAPYNANEVSGTGYTAGGTALLSTTFAHTSDGVLMWDAANPAWTSSTITNARAALIYADALSSPADPGIAWINFGGDFSTTSGTFTIEWASGGIMNVDVIP
jgi:hypothetical protein